MAAGPTGAVRAGEERGGTCLSPSVEEAQSPPLPPLPHSVIQLHLPPLHASAGLAAPTLPVPRRRSSKGQQCREGSPWGPCCRDLFYGCRVRVAGGTEGWQQAGPPQRSHAVTDWDVSHGLAPRLRCWHLVHWWVGGASPAPAQRGEACCRGWEDPFHCLEIRLPEMCQRQMLQPQVIYQGTLGSSCKKKGASLKGNC